MYDDMKSVSGSITVLGVALAFVYIVFFSVHGKELQPYPTLEELGFGQGGTGQQYTGDLVINTQGVLSSQDSFDNNPDDTLGVNDSLARDVGLMRPLPSPKAAVTFYSVQELFDADEVIMPSSLSLSGTHQWSGFMKTLALLGLEGDAQYILKNNLNTHFVYLDTLERSLQSTVLSLGGNIVEIADKNTITQHVLFGNKIQFINLPEYSQIKVLMLVWFDDQDDVWFLQIDYDTYHRQKPDLQKTFGQFYEW